MTHRIETAASGEAKHGDLKVWWIPQLPMKSFDVLVPDLQTAALIMDTLAEYDRFQFENKVKPDYCNAGGLSVFEVGPDGGDWFDWWDDESGMSFDEIRKYPEDFAALLARQAPA